MKKSARLVSGDDLRTRRRLLEAAGEVFAELGFRDATVREICRRAGANVAAVSYHFGDKAALYSEAMRNLAEASIKKFPPDMGVSPNSSPREKLEAFVRSFVLRILSDDRAALFGRILAREFVEPTHALADFVQSMSTPMRDLLLSLLRQLLPPGASDEQLRRCAFSIVGQIVFYKHCSPVIDLMFPGAERHEPRSLDTLADHIITFSLGGIHAIGASGSASRRAPTRGARQTIRGGRA